MINLIRPFARSLIPSMLLLIFLASCAHDQSIVISTSTSTATRGVLPSAGREQDRISDGVILADRRFLADLEKRLASLNANGVAARDYHLSKASAWLDFATEEYSDNDRGGTVEGALEQSVLLIRGLESRSPRLPMDTVIIKGSRRIRDDLWQRAERSKQHAEFACVAHRIARLEVQLVWAGHEEIEGGWRHAKPYIEIAEDMANQIDAAFDVCPTARARFAEPTVQTLAARSESSQPLPLPTMTPGAFPPLETPTRITLAADTLFRFQGAARDDIQAQALQELEALVGRLKGMGVIHRILITGHSDRLGDAAHNLKLSQARADTLRVLLIDRGVKAEQVQAAGAGESEPLVTCSGDRANAVLIDCLQANRRVEIRVFATPALTPKSTPKLDR
jgi:OmpA-OmpF porin, OOP family